MTKLIAVLTGDLIGSSKAGEEALQASMRVARSVGRDVGLWPSVQDTRFTRSRGDGWQMVLARPALSLRVALAMQARLRSWPGGLATRIAVGIGAVDGLGTRDLSDAGGAAFVASGQGLDRMGRGRMMVSCGTTTPAMQAIIGLADEIARRWTREQAEAMTLALPPDDPTLETMATELQISRQAVNYRLTGAGLRAIRAALTGWEDMFDAGLITGVS